MTISFSVAYLKGLHRGIVLTVSAETPPDPPEPGPTKSSTDTNRKRSEKIEKRQQGERRQKKRGASTLLHAYW